MQVSNVNYILYLLSSKTRQLQQESRVDFALSKRRLMSMESQYSIDSLLHDTYERKHNQ